MQYRRMGRCGLKVSTITLGTLWFGLKVDEATAVRIVDRALAVGINSIDTADIYGKDRWDTPERGSSEEIVGRALKGRRGAVVLATKVAARPAGRCQRPGPQPQAHRGGHARESEAPADRLRRPLLPARARLHDPVGGIARDAQRSGAPRQDPLHRALELLRLAGVQGLVGSRTERTWQASTVSRWSTTCWPATPSWR